MSEAGTALIDRIDEPLLEDGGTDHLLEAGPYDRQAAGIVYPHETGEPVTAEALQQHMADHPEAYHPDLQAHIHRKFGAPAVSGETSTTPEPYTEGQIRAAEKYIKDWHDPYYEEEDELREPPVPIDKLLLMQLPPSFVADYAYDLRHFGLDAEVVHRIIEKGNIKDVEELLQNKDELGLELTGALAHEIISAQGDQGAKYIADGIANRYEDEVLDDDGYPWFPHKKFNGLNAQNAYELVRHGEGEAVQEKPEVFADLECNTDLALEVLKSKVPLKLEAYHKLDDRVAQESMKGSQDDSGHDQAQRVRNNLFRFEGLSPETLDKLSEAAGRPIREFPHGENRRAQYEWYADMAYTDLRGWPKAKLGQLIALRIEQGLEHDLHDATQWLSEFDIVSDEGLGYDLATIQALRASGEDDPSSVLDRAEVRVVDLDTEDDILRAITHAPAELRARLNLPSKDQKVQQMFYYPENRLIYESLLPLFKQDGFTLEGLREAVWQNFDAFYDELLTGNHKDLAGQWTREDFRENVEQTLAGLESEQQAEQSISELVSQLQTMGEKRKAYIDDAMNWLLRHGTSPNDRLVKVWKDRPLALANGVHDSARAIEAWQKENAFQVTLYEYERAGRLPEGLTKEEVLSERWKNWRETLINDLSAANSVRSIEFGKRWLNKLGERAKILPPASIDFELGSEGKPEKFRFDVLAKDDPRGFVIGAQTGCCMTIDGESNSCIREGYRNPNAGFVALYGDDGRIRAQSFWYVHPEHPDVLVLDNIEANKGRDFNKLTQAYQQALRQYIEQQRSANPDFKITRVHVGEGYTDVNINHLPEAESIPALNEKIYTDANSQRLLLDMSVR